MALVSAHPNAIVGGISGAGGGSIVIALAAWAGVHLDTYEAGLVYAACSSLALFIGKNGLDGIRDLVLHGKNAPKK